MSMMYCYTCDRYIDSDVECNGCSVCLEDGKIWCWECCKGYTFKDKVECPIHKEHLVDYYEET